MIRQPITTKWRLGLAMLSVAVLAGSYTYLAHRQHLENSGDTTIPTWRQLKDGVVSALRVNPRSEQRWLVVDAKATALRLFLGLGCAVAGAIVIGLLMGCFPPLEAFCYPPLSLAAKVPPTAALAVFFVLVGTDLHMFIAMITFGVLPTLALTVYLAVKEVPDELLYKAYTLGASHTEVVWDVICRYVLPRLLDAARLQIGPAMVYLIAAEMLVGDVGFGYRIRMNYKLLNMNVVYPYLAVLAAFGYAMDYAMRWFQSWVCPWYAPSAN